MKTDKQILRDDENPGDAYPATPPRKVSKTAFDDVEESVEGRVLKRSNVRVGGTGPARGQESDGATDVIEAE